MDKFGVVTDPDSSKTGAERKTHTCPICDQELLPADTTGVLLCPTHGSAPFEVTREASE